MYSFNDINPCVTKATIPRREVTMAVSKQSKGLAPLSGDRLETTHDKPYRTEVGNGILENSYLLAPAFHLIAWNSCLHVQEARELASLFS